MWLTPRLALVLTMNLLTLIIVCAMWLSMTSGCSVVIRPEKPPISLAPQERPALVDKYGSFSKPGQKWLHDLVNAYLRNCVTLKVLRGEDPMACQDGLR